MSTQWEYRVEVVHTSDLQKAANEWAREGWQVMFPPVPLFMPWASPDPDGLRFVLTASRLVPASPVQP